MYFKMEMFTKEDPIQGPNSLLNVSLWVHEFPFICTITLTMEIPIILSWHFHTKFVS